LIDVSTTHVVPAGVLDAQRTTDPVTGEPESANASLTQYPCSGLNAVVAVAVVLALPVVSVTAVEVENVALVAVVVVNAFPAVADTSGAGVKNMCAPMNMAAIELPMGTLKEPVEPDELNDFARARLPFDRL
jgi:hypothetical protein